MLRTAISSLFLALSFTALNATVGAADLRVRRPLDLPVGGPRFGESSDEEEETLPDSVQFFGGEYEGDAFFWCLDKSCSMGWQSAFDQVQAEVVASLESLSEASEFSVVAFSSGVISWSPTPREGNQSNRTDAIEWVRALEPGGASCLISGAIETIAISNRSEALTKNLILLSDGAPGCTGGESTELALEAITRANWQHSPIHTIFIASDPEARQFLQSVSRTSGGSFRQPPGTR